MDSSLELKDGTAKGYKVTKKNIKEKPDEKSFSLNEDRKSTRQNSSHGVQSRMPSSA